MSLIPSPLFEFKVAEKAFWHLDNARAETKVAFQGLKSVPSKRLAKALALCQGALDALEDARSELEKTGKGGGSNES